MLRGSTEILNTVCDHLGGIKPGQTTKDGKFTVVEVECQGACSNAPMLVVGDDFYVCKSGLRDLALPDFYFDSRRILHQKRPRKFYLPLRKAKSPRQAHKVVGGRVRIQRDLPR